MAKPNRLKEIELEHGLELSDLIPKKLNELGSMEAVSRNLDVSLQTIFRWCKKNKVRRTVTWQKESNS